jgi:hypothetical protein
MAELVDAGDLKSPILTNVRVRVPFWVPNKIKRTKNLYYKKIQKIITSSQKIDLLECHL